LQSPGPPQFVYWQRNDRMVNYDDNRRDISIETIPGPRTQSRLIIKEPQISDSGNYKNLLSFLEPIFIFMFSFQKVITHVVRLTRNQHQFMFMYRKVREAENNFTSPCFRVKRVQLIHEKGSLNCSGKKVFV
jgi:hypothetical protein